MRFPNLLRKIGAVYSVGGIEAARQAASALWERREYAECAQLATANAAERHRVVSTNAARRRNSEADGGLPLR